MNSFNDNELDRWLRQSAGQGHEPPAPDGWDTPPEDVWAQLRADLDQRRKRRRLLWAVWSVALIGLAGAAWHAGTPSRSQPFRTEEKGNVVTPLNEPSNSSFSENTNPQIALIETKSETVIPDNSGPAAGTLAYVKPAPHPDVAPVRWLPADDKPSATELSGIIPPPAAGTGTANAQITREAVDAPVPLPVAPAPLTGKPAYLPSLNLFPVSPVIRPQKDRPRLYAGFTTGMFFTTRKLQHAGTDVPNGRESGACTWQQGLSLAWKFHRHWAVESGLQRAAVHLQAQRELQFRYRLNQEKFDQQRFLYQNSANDVMETSFGAVEMRMDVGREPSRPVNDLAVFRVTLRTDEQARYWRMPLTLRWSPAARGPWQWSLAGGIGLNFSAGYELSLDAARANRPGIRGVSARLSGNANGLAPMMTDLQLGGQLAYRLSQRCTLSLSPEFRYGLSPMYRGAAFRSLAVSQGIHAGILWQL